MPPAMTIFIGRADPERTEADIEVLASRGPEHAQVRAVADCSSRFSLQGGAVCRGRLDSGAAVS